MVVAVGRGGIFGKGSMLARMAYSSDWRNTHHSMLFMTCSRSSDSASRVVVDLDSRCEARIPLLKSGTFDS